MSVVYRPKDEHGDKNASILRGNAFHCKCEIFSIAIHSIPTQ